MILCLSKDILNCNDLNFRSCMQYFYEYIETPVFVLNPFYDSYQISMIKGLFCLPPECSPEKMAKFYENRDVSSF